MTAREPCKILIVDDEVLIRQGIKHYVNWEQEGFRIVGEASNGQEALAMVEKLRPHVVLTDIVMPVMDGEELTRVIKTAYPEIEVVVLSSFGEFEYVRSTFQNGVADYILKPKLETRELLDVIRKTALRIPSLQLLPAHEKAALPVERILEQRIAGYETVEDEAVVREAFPYDGFCLLGADLKALPPDGGAWPDRLIAFLEAEIRRQWPEAALRSVAVRPDQVVALLNADSLRVGDISKPARSLAEAAAAAFPQAVLAVGAPYADFAETAAAYREGLLKLLQAGFYFPGRRLFLHDELPALASPGRKPRNFPLDRFADLFRRGQFEEAFGELKDHVDALAGDCATDVFEYQSFLSNLIFNITVLLGNMEYGVSGLERAKYAYFNAINEARCAAEAAERLFAFIEEARGCIRASSRNPNVSNMKMLLDYIDRHYAEPLTLKDMARHFHFNPSYLSSYFAQHNKEGFVEHLNKIRTEKAAELLRGDDAPISEISARVGYSDHSYFCKVFKKMTGFSPSQYRRRYRH